MDAIEYYNKYASKIFEETVEEESRAIKIAVPRGKGGTLS